MIAGLIEQLGGDGRCANVNDVVGRCIGPAALVIHVRCAAGHTGAFAVCDEHTLEWVARELSCAVCRMGGLVAPQTVVMTLPVG